LNFALTFLIISVLFACIFKLLPDAKIKWRHVKVGAFTTALLFMLGRFLISLYLSNSKIDSTYGAAGSIVVILLWVYYSSTILYFGAVYTKVYLQVKGLQIYPNQYAVWVNQVELENKASLTEAQPGKTVVEAKEKN
jgi:membrane protein